MTDREALTAAIEDIGRSPYEYAYLGPIVTAARERLAQLPEECPDEKCINGWIALVDGVPVFHDGCNGSGKVYPAELVERIAVAIAHAMSTANQGIGRQFIAVAVLDALNGETP